MYIVDNKLYKDEWLAIETERLRLAVLRKSAVDKVTDYYVRNLEFHRQWSQTHSDDYFTKKTQKQYLKADEVGFFNDELVPFYVCAKDDRERIIGRVSLFNIARGGMQSAIIGYHQDENSQGNGYMLEAVKAATAFGIEYMKLHRIEACIMPHNERSLNLIRKAGYEEDGYKRKYMHINGEWRDHISFAFLDE